MKKSTVTHKLVEYDLDGICHLLNDDDGAECSCDVQGIFGSRETVL